MGHHIHRKRPWASAGYLLTALSLWHGSDEPFERIGVIAR